MPTPQQLAQEWLADRETVILDTETTGLADDDQIVELSIIDMQGRTLLDTLVKPTVPIHPKAQAVHGIRHADVLKAPSLPELASKLDTILRDRRVITYNARFDGRLLEQTYAAHDLEPPQGISYDCAMLAYASWYRPGGRWQKLGNAAEQTTTPITGRAHRALTDCHTTLGVIRAMASSPNYLEYQPPAVNRLRTATGARLSKMRGVPTWKWVVLGVGVAFTAIGWVGGGGW